MAQSNNKIRIGISGTEYEYFAVDAECEEGFDSYSGFCNVTSVETDDDSYEDVEISEIFSDKIDEFNISEDTENEIVGIRAYENSATIYIEVDADEFDPTKLKLTFRPYKFIIDDERSYTTEDSFLSEITYDGKKYEIVGSESDGFGSEIVWGIDPEEEDYDEDDEEEYDDEE